MKANQWIQRARQRGIGAWQRDLRDVSGLRVSLKGSKRKPEGGKDFWRGKWIPVSAAACQMNISERILTGTKVA